MHITFIDVIMDLNITIYPVDLLLMSYMPSPEPILA